tara:strand:- start:429 stop:770 length:342 start_codon:yes stop_codon:yes gene_type:complete
MTTNIDSHYLGLALLLAALGNYFCRAGGVYFSKHINPDSELFLWLSAVTYAMIAALTARLILLPNGSLSQVPVLVRIIVCCISLGIMLSRPQGRLLPALATGTALIMIYEILK